MTLARRHLAALALLVPSLSAAGHADFGAAMDAYGARDYAAARTLFLDLAELGDAPSQFNLGAMALRGEGMARDRGAALGWLTAARQNGYEVQDSLLARLRQEATPADEAAAAALVARYGIEALRASVLPRPPDERPCTGELRAPVLVSRPEVSGPARRSEVDQVHVLVRYRLGADGLSRDEAVLYSDPPLERGGEPFAQAVLRTIAEQRFQPATCDGKPVEVTVVARTSFADDEGFQLRRWLLTSVHDRARNGSPYHQYVLGVMAAAQPAVGVPPSEGWKLLVSAAQAGIAEAQLAVAGLALSSQGKEREKALPWLRRAAEAGLPSARAALVLERLRRAEPVEEKELAAAATTSDPALRRRLLSALACSGRREAPAVRTLSGAVPLAPGSDLRTAEAVAAARAAAGDFAGAAAAERQARDRARELGLDPAPFEARALQYQAGRPCVADPAEPGTP